MPYVLSPQLAADTVRVTTLPLCDVRLMKDRSWPWLVLVPERDALVELLDLDVEDRRALIEEIALASSVLRDLFQPDKLNVAALGNQVSQLHVHVIARSHHDPAWPRPIWGTVVPVEYRPHELETTIGALQDAFARNRTLFPDVRSPDTTAAEPDVRVWSFFGFTDR
jgi:diadenosine tetraphosphate (Ap4A) HIT family hydrolase